MNDSLLVKWILKNFLESDELWFQIFIPKCMDDDISLLLKCDGRFPWDRLGIA
jgi:hypothetical protein